MCDQGLTHVFERARRTEDGTAAHVEHAELRDGRVERVTDLCPGKTVPTSDGAEIVCFGHRHRPGDEKRRPAAVVVHHQGVAVEFEAGGERRPGPAVEARDIGGLPADRESTGGVQRRAAPIVKPRECVDAGVQPAAKRGPALAVPPRDVHRRRCARGVEEPAGKQRRAIIEAVRDEHHGEDPTVRLAADAHTCPHRRPARSVPPRDAARLHVADVPESAAGEQLRPQARPVVARRQRPG